MPRYRVTIMEVLTHSGTVEVEAESEEEAQERAQADDGCTFADLTQRTAELHVDVEPVED